MKTWSSSSLKAWGIQLIGKAIENLDIARTTRGPFCGRWPRRCYLSERTPKLGDLNGFVRFVDQLQQG